MLGLVPHLTKRYTLTRDKGLSPPQPNALEEAFPTGLRTLRVQAETEPHLVQCEQVECALLHSDVIHLVALQGNPSQSPASLLGGGPGQPAPEVSILALTELHVLQGFQNGHLRD